MTIQEEITQLEIKLASSTGSIEQADLILEILKKYISYNSKNGEHHLTQLIQIAEELNQVEYRAWAHYHQGIIHRITENFSASLEETEKALQLFSLLNHEQGMAKAHGNIGNVYWSKGNYAEALSNYFAALKINEVISDKVGIANSYNNIGIVYFDRGSYPEALSNSFAALKIREELGDQQGIAMCLNNVASIYKNQNKLSEALSKHLAAQKLFEQIGDQPNLAHSYNNTGDIYRILENYSEALTNHLLGLRISEELNLQELISFSLTLIGKTYLELKEYAKAKESLIKALEIAEEINSKTEIKNALKTNYELNKATGDSLTALTYYEQYVEAEKEFNNEEIAGTIANLQFGYQIEKKEQEAKLLKEKNEEVQLYADKLENSNNALKQFANVASHDLREPLRMISSYMTLLEKTLQDINPQQTQFIAFVTDGAKRMEQLIHDLLRLAKVDANPQIETVSLNDIVKEISSNLEVLTKEKNAQIVCGDLPMVKADRTQMLQLFQNIIANGIKYNENLQPAINIDCVESKEEIKISISDNGIGIPEQYREKVFQLFQRIKTAKEYSGTGLGLAICKKIVDGMNGSIQVEDNPTGGTIFKISLPLSILCK